VTPKRPKDGGVHFVVVFVGRVSLDPLVASSLDMFLTFWHALLLGLVCPKTRIARFCMVLEFDDKWVTDGCGVWRGDGQWA
jgi:uncharacterized protein (DUF983 family)